VRTATRRRQPLTRFSASEHGAPVVTPTLNEAPEALLRWFSGPTQSSPAHAHEVGGARPRLGADGVLALQRASGNAAVAGLLGAHGSGNTPLQVANGRLQRAPDGAFQKLDPRAIDDELHLRASFWGSDAAEGSRLDTAFHNNRPLTAADNGPDVKKMQEALIAVGSALPRSGADGKWGDETNGAVVRFQAANGIPVSGGAEAGRKTFLALDAHLGAGPGPKPNPQPNPTPTPKNDAELESVLDRIDVAYQKMITRERDGVEALGRDLSNLDQPKPSDAQQLLFFMLSVISASLYGLGEGALRLAIKKEINEVDVLSEATKSDIDNANDKVFDSMNDRFLKDLTSVPKGDESRADLLADFSDKHLEAVTNAGFGAADSFEAEGKPRLRKSSGPSAKRDARNQSGDPRVDGALQMMDNINSQANAAFQLHYDKSLQAWDSKLAQAKLGRDSDNVEDTNLEPLKGSGDVGQGILRVLLDILSGPTEQVVDAKIDGLSPRVRTKLTGKTPADAGLPVVADGSTGSRTMRVGITEHQNVVDLTTSDSGGQFLVKRGGGDRREGVLRVANTVLTTPLPKLDSA
jgi:hypothetical protein